ncbi:MAG: hypothetical protein E7E64_11740 [Clostridium celatum]|nr:hypothetical protein [Clostridium sp.]MDU2123204.1 hypothetical protein [Clostridium celatum]MDU4980755.1 hypothetical protein [Clostridium celatum]
MSIFNKIFLIAMIPIVAFWMIFTGDNEQMALLLNDIYKDKQNK